jgi:hypothetical protein
MITKLINFIKNIFHSSGNTEGNEHIVQNSYSDVAHTPADKIKAEMKKNAAKYAPKPLPTKNSSAKTSQSSNMQGVQKQIVKKINKQDLDKKIKNNIFFINSLMEKMDSIEEYSSYYKKLKDLKTQSKNSLSLLHRMSEEAPYYFNTVKAILKHTTVIGRLVEIEN